MSLIPKPYEVYKHFKGNLYQVLTIAEHSETGGQMVIYQALYGDFKIYARPLELFTGKVDRQKYPNASQEYRFELQTVKTPEQGEKIKAEGNPVFCYDSETETETESKPKPAKTVNQTNENQGTETGLDPAVMEFLDAENYEQRLNILAGVRHRITDDMLTTMAIACDVEIPDGNLQERLESLKNCLLTLEKYECNRIR